MFFGADACGRVGTGHRIQMTRQAGSCVLGLHVTSMPCPCRHIERLQRGLTYPEFQASRCH